MVKTVEAIRIKTDAYNEAMQRLDSARALCESLATLQHGNPECPPSHDQLAGSLYGIAALLNDAAEGMRNTVQGPT